MKNIIIIYNPHSTGGAQQKSAQLEQQLKQRLPDASIKRIPTERAGHATELAQGLADEYDRPLLISVSGDGGYNDLIGGVMALPKSKRPICAVYPAGNANDHRRATRKRDLVESIVRGSTQAMDILTITPNGDIDGLRYAHSYIGLGITPVVAVELNRHTLTALREAWIVFSTFWQYRPFTIIRKGKKQTMNSLVFANISEMAKVVTLDERADPTDGRFEVVIIPSGDKSYLLRTGLIAAFSSLKADERTSSYTFTTMSPLPMQLDGEVVELEAGLEVEIGIKPSAITTIV